MSTILRARLLHVVAWAALVVIASTPCGATGVPIDGFLPMTGISLTREFVDDITTAPVPSTNLAAPQLGAGGTPHYDVALLDTGAAVTLVNAEGRAAFGLDEPYNGQGGDDGFVGGAETITIGGATGFVDGHIHDLLGVYAGGLQTRDPGGSAFTLNNSLLLGQTNTSIVSVPSESDLPNVLGLSFVSQYATRIRADQPQVFTLNGQTVRTPSIEFLPLGSGGMGITRKAPLSINGASPVMPQHVPVLDDPFLLLESPWENPFAPTFVSGGLFLNVNVEDDLAGDGGALTNFEFFFDTGASVTVVSELNALRLGFDVLLDEPEFSLAIVGSAGIKRDVPGFFVDEFTIQAIGGSIVAKDVPVIVLDIVDPADPNNVIEGFVGTNLLAGRNLMIDPNPAISGGPTAGLYVSDPVTTQRNRTSAAASGLWQTAGSWSGNAIPGMLDVANVRHVTGGDQQVIVSSEATAWEVNVSGSADNQRMALRIENGAKLTTFAGLSIEQHGVIALDGGTLDVQYVDIRDGGRLFGEGSIVTGSGPITGQVENVSGIVSPGDGVGVLSIEGRYSNGTAGILEIDIDGLEHDRLTVDGAATLAGMLAVAYAGAAPDLGSTYLLLSSSDGVAGEFDALDFDDLPSDRMWHLGYGEQELVLSVTLPGDFDGDFDVDAADLDVWRTGYGETYTDRDFLAWQRNLGSSVASVNGVPEPTAATMVAGLACSLLAGLGRRRRCRRRPERLRRGRFSRSRARSAACSRRGWSCFA